MRRAEPNRAKRGIDMSRTTNKQARPLTLRQRNLIDALPDCDWSIVKAGIAAGYSPAYAESTLARTVKSNAGLCKAIEAKRQSIQVKSRDDVELVQHTMRQVLDDPTSSFAQRARASDILMRIAGAYSERRIIETTARVEQIDQARLQHAKRLAIASRVVVGPAHDAPMPNSKAAHAHAPAHAPTQARERRKVETPRAAAGSPSPVCP